MRGTDLRGLEVFCFENDCKVDDSLIDIKGVMTHCCLETCYNTWCSFISWLIETCLKCTERILIHCIPAFSRSHILAGLVSSLSTYFMAFLLYGRVVGVGCCTC